MWKRANTEVTAPADGLVSRRTARIGGMAAGAAEPMFRIVARGEVELDAEVIETELAKVTAGQKARVNVAGVGDVDGTVRLVSPEVDKLTRLGRVRIFLGDDPRLRIGAFARGTIETAQSRGLAVPSSAVVFDAGGAFVQVVRDGRVETPRRQDRTDRRRPRRGARGPRRRRHRRRPRRHLPARRRCRARRRCPTAKISEAK